MHFTVVVKAVSYMVEVQSLSSWTADAGLRLCVFVSACMCCLLPFLTAAAAEQFQDLVSW